MSLITMPVYDTEENRRSSYTRESLRSLRQTVNPEKHTVYIVDNNSCKETKELIRDFSSKFPAIIITNSDNLGPAGAVNKSWKFRKSNQHGVKIDNDVKITQENWADDMEKILSLDPRIGILGLKRKVLPKANENDIINLGEFTIERCNDVIGTCVMHSSNFLNKAGYLHGTGFYGYEDSLMCERSLIGGFYNAFYPKVDLEYLDPGDNIEYSQFKVKYATSKAAEYIKLSTYYKNTRNIFYDPDKQFHISPFINRKNFRPARTTIKF